MFNRHEGLPPELYWVLYNKKAWRTCAMEHSVKPIITFESLKRNSGKNLHRFGERGAADNAPRLIRDICQHKFRPVRSCFRLAATMPLPT